MNKIAGAVVVDHVIKTDSAGDCNKARRLLQVKYRGTFCVSACAAHTLDRLLEDIGKFKRFANTIATMRVIGKVIMAHAASRHECKDKNGGSFGTCCIMCESAKENKSALTKTVVRPSYFSFTKGQGLSHHALGKLTKECVPTV
jgi:hypothetical protein